MPNRMISDVFCSALLLLVQLPGSALQAADGDVIISRDVQPRAATRAPLVPDPNPRAVNASPNHYMSGGLLGGVELDDQDFAAIRTGSELTQHLLAPQSNSLTAPSASSHSRLPGLAPGHAGGNATAGVGAQINRSVQQGLRPLQMQGGQ